MIILFDCTCFLCVRMNAAAAITSMGRRVKFSKSKGDRSTHGFYLMINFCSSGLAFQHGKKSHHHHDATVQAQKTSEHQSM